MALSAMTVVAIAGLEYESFSHPSGRLNRWRRYFLARLGSTPRQTSGGEVMADAAWRIHARATFLRCFDLRRVDHRACAEPAADYLADRGVCLASTDPADRDS